MKQERNGGERRAPGGLALPPAFHTLANDMSLNKDATHFTLGLRYYLSLPIINVPAPLSKNYPVVPLALKTFIYKHYPLPKSGESDLTHS